MAGDRIIQLAKNVDQLSPKAAKQAFEYGGYESEKLDGVWVAAVCNDGKISFKSSTLEDYVALEGTELEADIRELHVKGWTNFVLIGEAYKEGLEQADISGKCRTAIRGYADTIELHVHDILNLEEWMAGEATLNFEQRLAVLDTTLPDELCTASLKRLPQSFIDSPESLKRRAETYQSQGGEGICYRPRFAGWVSGNRGTNLVRIKQKITYDLQAVGVSGVEPGAKGGLKGVLLVKWRKFGQPDGESSIQEIRGMSHTQLREWALDPTTIIGKIVEVEAMKFTAYGTLREPRFKSIREDKVIPDVC